MEIFLFWFLFSIIVGWAATTKGHSGIGFFILSILLSPLLGLIVVSFISRNEEELFNGTMKNCPSCKELVKIDAVKCKHCGAELNFAEIFLEGIEKHVFKTGLISYKIPKNIFSWDELNNIVLNIYSDMTVKKNTKEELLLESPKKFNDLMCSFIKLKNLSESFNLETFGFDTPSFLLHLNDKKNNLKSDDTITKLIELSKLFEKGLITKEEFENHKIKLNS